MVSRVSLSGSDSDTGTVDFEVQFTPKRIAPNTPESVGHGEAPGNVDFQGKASSVHVIPARPRLRRESWERGDERDDRRVSTRGRSPG